MTTPSIAYQRRQPEKTVLYQTIAAHLNTFLCTLEQEGKSLPKHVEEELRAFLKCGILAHGFARVKCEDCPKEFLVAFSCKKRGFCPSCGTKRMSETAAHLVDNILPRARIRQYVLSVPFPLRYWMASNKKLLAKVHKIFASVIDGFYCQQDDQQSGSVTFVQRFGSALNLNVHFHMLQIEGCYSLAPEAKPQFRKHRPPTNCEIEDLVASISTKVINLLRRSGYLAQLEPEESSPDSLLDEQPTYASCMSASVKHRIATGARCGQRVRFIGSGFGYEDEGPTSKGERCAISHGFSLHANVAIAKHRRDQLERLIRYTARPAVHSDRLSLTAEGNIQYELKKPWSNGTTHVLLSCHELLEKLCSLVPLPNMHLVRFWGVLAPHAKLRSKVIAGKTRAQIKHDEEVLTTQEGIQKKKNATWAKLLSRVFGFELRICPECSGRMQLIASIYEPEVIQKILLHIGLDPIPPPIAPARYVNLWAS